MAPRQHGRQVFRLLHPSMGAEFCEPPAASWQSNETLTKTIASPTVCSLTKDFFVPPDVGATSQGIHPFCPQIFFCPPLGTNSMTPIRIH